MIGKLRKPPKAVVPRLRPDPGNCDTRRTTLDQRTHTALSSDSDSDSDDANPDVNAGGEDDDDATNELTEAVPVEVGRLGVGQ